jgi:predicted nucleic acid-binding protein
MPGYVLDTSACLAHLNGEVGGELVQNLLERARAGKRDAPRLVMPFMSLMEVEYLLLRQQGRVRAEQIASILLAWPAEVIESSEEWRHQAARIKATGRISTADAWIAGLAIWMDAELVHKDPEYDRIKGLKVIKLPYRK